jgi:hypothetical protein
MMIPELVFLRALNLKIIAMGEILLLISGVLVPVLMHMSLFMRKLLRINFSFSRRESKNRLLSTMM